MAFYDDFYLFTFDADGKQHRNYAGGRGGRNLNFDLAGAVLFELALYSRLQLSDDEKRLTVTDLSSLGNPILDEALQFVAGYDRRDNWLDYKYPHVAGDLGRTLNLETRLRDAWTAGGWIESREQRRLFGSSTIYVLANQTQWIAMRDKLRGVIFQNAAPDPATALLFFYLQLCWLMEYITSPKEKKLFLQQLTGCSHAG